MDRSDWGEPRSRTLGATMSGLDHLRAVAAGELPAEQEVLDAAGKVLATATTSCLVMPG